MGFIDAIGIIFDSLPIVRKLWRWMWERDMELELREPHSQIVRGSSGLNVPDGTKPIMSVNVGENPHIYIWLDLVLTNHRTTRREVITNCELHLKKRHWLFWEQTIASAPVLVESVPTGSRNQTAWRAVTLDPVSPPVIVSVTAQGDITYPVSKFPRKLRLVLEFRMVGPRRCMRRVIQEFKHDPNAMTNS